MFIYALVLADIRLIKLVNYGIIIQSAPFASIWVKSQFEKQRLQKKKAQ